MGDNKPCMHSLLHGALYFWILIMISMAIQGNWYGIGNGYGEYIQQPPSKKKGENGRIFFSYSLLRLKLLCMRFYGFYLSVFGMIMGLWGSWGSWGSWGLRCHGVRSWHWGLFYLRIFLSPFSFIFLLTFLFLYKMRLRWAGKE